MKRTFLIIAFASLLAIVSAEFYLVSTGPDSKRIRQLSTSSIETVCPSDYPSGFSIECVTGTQKSISIRLNGKWLRSEKHAPYFVAGDVRGNPRPWKDYPKHARISCRAKRIHTKLVSVTMNFECNAPENDPSAHPGPTSHPTSSPSTSEELPSPSSTPSSSTLTNPSYMNPSTDPDSDSNNDPYFNTDSDRDSNRKKLTIDQIKVGCILLDARTDLNDSKLSPKWVVDDDNEGLTFRKDDEREWVTKENISPLYYKVRATRNSRFAIIVDMTTRKTAEHNDIWISFQPGDLQAMRKQTPVAKKGWIKAYHGKNGRAALILTVDFTPHVISTGEVLVKGNDYLLGIGGRSSMVTVHRIVLFPCSGNGCQRGWHWRRSLATCLPDMESQN